MDLRHYRVTVSSDGSKADRIDLLSQFIRQQESAEGKLQFITSSQVASNIPVETWIYSSNLYHIPVGIGTMDGSFWLVANGKIHKLTKAELRELESKKGKK